MVEIEFSLRDAAGAGLDNEASRYEFLHLVFGIPPISAHSHHFILGVAFGGSAGAGHADKSVYPACSFLNVLVKIVDVLLPVSGELRIEFLLG